MHCSMGLSSDGWTRANCNADLALAQHLLAGSLHKLLGLLPQLVALLLELVQRAALLLGESLVVLCGIAAPLPVLQKQVLCLFSQPLGLQASCSTPSQLPALRFLCGMAS